MPKAKRSLTRLSRLAHRYLGIFAAAQLLLWTSSGLFFSCNAIGSVRGTPERAPACALVAPSSASPGKPLASPSLAIAALVATKPDARVLSVTLRPLGRGSVYVLRYRRGDKGSARFALARSDSGALRSPLSRDEAIDVARRDFAPSAAVRDVERITQRSRGSEFRGKSLPLYGVRFDHPRKTRIYVSATRAKVVARRNAQWRWFDWFWMLHTMDYRDRDDFNTWWLQALALLGLVTVLSGLALFVATNSWLRRRRRPQ
ncbi:MAG: hypothetical protein KC503_15755 [Myxococcales bacterium]|nr:hypothetical protein [Myxococcales bacterium]